MIKNKPKEWGSSAEGSSKNQLNLKGVDEEIKGNTERDLRKTRKPKLESGGPLTTGGGQVMQFYF